MAGLLAWLEWTAVSTQTFIIMVWSLFTLRKYVPHVDMLMRKICISCVLAQMLRYICRTPFICFALWMIYNGIVWYKTWVVSHQKLLENYQWSLQHENILRQSIDYPNIWNCILCINSTCRWLEPYSWQNSRNDPQTFIWNTRKSRLVARWHANV